MEIITQGQGKNWSAFSLGAGRENKHLDYFKISHMFNFFQTQPEKESEWPDSMSWLMKKLEQLNLDIEEALSASSSPSSTPSSKRHKQLVRICVCHMIPSLTFSYKTPQAIVFRSSCVSQQAKELRCQGEVKSFHSVK